MQQIDKADEVALESLKRQIEDEEKLEEFYNISDLEVDRPLPLVLFLNTDGASSFLKSKSAVECLARESQNEDNIHLLMIGKGMNPSADKLKRSSQSSRSNTKAGPSQ